MTQIVNPSKQTRFAMLCMYDFIAANPGSTMVDICAHFKQPANTLRKPLGLLRDEGYLSKATAPGNYVGKPRHAYTVTKKRRPEIANSPLPAPVSRPRIPDAHVKRRFTQATQIGMVRDSLIEALFGPAVHA